jgi:hypothetical protein
MTTPLSSSPPHAPAPPSSPSTTAKSHYNSAYVQIETFVFNPTLVTGFLHRPATNDESVPVTEVLYGGHHVTVEDKHQHLFHFLCHHTAPGMPTTTI